MDRVCVIGAGSSGIASCQVLDARGIPFDCFEKGSGVGGNWRYDNDNEMSSAYESLHINTSQRIMEYATYPMPDDYPDFPSHRQIAAYFDDYVDHFGFRDKIRFNTEVIARRAGRGGRLGGDARRTAARSEYARGDGGQRPSLGPALSRAAVPRRVRRRGGPRPPLPDARRGTRAGTCSCSGSATRRWTSRSSSRASPTHDLPGGAARLPRDPEVPAAASRSTSSRTRSARRLPFTWSRDGRSRRRSRRAGASPRTTGCRRPTTGSGEAHPTVSSEILNRIGHGDVTVKPNIERLEGDSVRFVGRLASSRSTGSCGARATRSRSRSSTTSSSRPATTRSSCTGASCRPTCPASTSSG